MANWTNIPTDRIEPGKPIRAIDGLALRDNPIAIAQGAAGAPKITENAMNVNSIHGNRIRNGTVTNAQIADNTIQGSKFNDASVRSWIGSQAAGAVGTYAIVIFRATGNTTVNWGGTVAGSEITYWFPTGDVMGSDTYTPALSGTWRVMGRNLHRSGSGTSSNRAPALALRVS